MVGALQSSAAAFARHRDDLNDVAARTVAAPHGEIADRMVELAAVSRGARVAARVMRVSEETLGTLLDLMA